MKSDFLLWQSPRELSLYLVDETGSNLVEAEIVRVAHN
jgi:hypothetical protein